MKKFRIICKFCGNTEQDKIQTTMEEPDGYSPYTILASGFLEFKCKKCGTFGSTDENKKGANNKLNMFEVTCVKCGSHNFEYDDGSLEDLPEIRCKECKNNEVKL